MPLSCFSSILFTFAYFFEKTTCQSNIYKETSRMKKSNFLVVAAALAATSLLPTGVRGAGNATLPPLAGCVVASEDWGGSEWNRPYGVYALQAEGGTLVLQQVSTSGNMNANGGSVMAADRLMCLNYEGDYGYMRGRMYAYSPDDWTTMAQLYVGDMSMVSTASAYVAADGAVYGSFYDRDGNNFELGAYDPTASYLRRSTVAKLSGRYVAMAAGTDGTLYAITTTGQLMSVDRQNGTETVVGATGVTPALQMQSACCDPATGRMFWAATTSATTSALYEVDTTTGSATLLYNIPGGAQLASIWVVQPLAADDAPAAAENLTFNFDGPALEGTVSFDVPTLTYGGSQLTGTVDYTVTWNDETLATGTAQAGDHVTTDAFTLGNDYCQLVVVLSNEAGRSPKCKAMQYVGPDTPNGVDEATLEVSGGQAVVSWSASEGSVNGGYFVQDEVTYTIIRFPGEEVVAEGLKTTTFAEALPADMAMASLYYRVIPVFMGNEGWYAETNKVTVGSAFEVPYEETFDEEGALDLFTVIDGGDDYMYWSFGWGNIYSQTPYDYDSDEWIITPPVHLVPGQFYDFTVSYWGGYDGYAPHAFELGFGKEATAEAMTIVGRKQGILLPSEDDKKEYKTLVKVDEEGNYYFGLHDVSPAGGYVLYVDRIAVSEGSSLGVPAAVTDLAVTEGEGDALTAIVTLTAPTATAAGEALTDLAAIDLSRDGQLIHTFSNPAPGEQLSFTDTEVTGGQHVYAVVCRNGEGESQEAETTVRLGSVLPGMPENLHIEEQGDHVHIAWDAPTTNYEGGVQDSAGLTYTVAAVAYYTQEMTIVADNYEGTEIDDATTFDVDGDQRQVYYLVQAKNRTGVGEPAQSNQIIVGRPDTLPFKEGWPSEHPNQMEHLWWIDLTRDLNSMSFFRMSVGDSSDGDDGCAMFMAGGEGVFCNLNSGKISLQGAAKPVLTFSYETFSFSATARLEVRVTTDLVNWETVGTLTNDDFVGDDYAWKQLSLDLSQWKDEPFIYLTFHGEADDSDSPVTIDDVNIVDEGVGTSIASLQTSAMRVSTVRGGLVVSGVSEPVQVFTLDGRRLCSGWAGQTISLQPGGYVVVAGRQAMKVTVAE